MNTLIALLLLAVDLLAACLCWLSFGQGDYYAAAFFLLLLVVGVCSERVLVMGNTAPHVVDFEERKRQLYRAAITTDEHRTAAR